jgi:hypothetical protein
MIRSWFTFEVKKSDIAEQKSLLYPNFASDRLHFFPFSRKNVSVLKVNPNIDVFNDEQMNHLDLLTKLDIIEKIKIKAIFKMNELNETEKRKLSHPIEEILVKLNTLF